VGDTATNANGIEPRRPPRYRCDLGITIEWGAAHLEGRVSDISAGGMFVSVGDPLWIGARFAATLALDSSLPVECVVRRVHPRRGMGVTYMVAPGDGATLDSYIKRLEKE
jgi:hypothetical protein